MWVQLISAENGNEGIECNKDKVQLESYCFNISTMKSQVTQSAVDRYVDGILLNTIYKKAGVEAGKGG